MLSFKLVLCFYFIQSFVNGQFRNKYYPEDEKSVNENSENELLKSTPTDVMPDEQCPQDKSLHSKDDISVMIDYMYKQLAIDEKLSKAYKSQATVVRDSYIQDLEQFIDWFQHQPEHLKHVLDGLGQVRVKHVEPIVQKIAKVLNSFPELENHFNDKNNKLRKLSVRQKRYENMCRFNCGGSEDHYIYKREVQSNYYCSSIEELHNKITQKLHIYMEQIKTKMINQLSIDNDNYKTNIDKIKNNLKDKALQEFGRTMYDILILQDEYHHFVEDINITTIETKIISIQELSVQLDDKLLQMHKTVEKYGQHCKSCDDVLLVRNTRRTNAHFNETIEGVSDNIVDSLIDIKFNETVIEIKTDWDRIFKDLNELIQKVEEKDINLAPLIPIQKDVVKMTNEERQTLEKLKNVAPQSTIKNVLDLVRQSQDLLQTIDDNIVHIQSLM